MIGTVTYSDGVQAVFLGMGNTAVTPQSQYGTDAFSTTATESHSEAESQSSETLHYSRTAAAPLITRRRCVGLVLAIVAFGLGAGLYWRTKAIGQNRNIGPIDWAHVVAHPPLWPSLCRVLFNPKLATPSPPTSLSPGLPPFLGYDPAGFTTRIVLPFHYEEDVLTFALQVTNTSTQCVAVPSYVCDGVVGIRGGENQWSIYETEIPFACSGVVIKFFNCLGSNVQLLQPGETTDVLIRIMATEEPLPFKIQLWMYGCADESVVDPDPRLNNWNEVSQADIDSARFAPGIPAPPPR